MQKRVCKYTHQHVMALLFDNNENNNTNEGQKKKMGEKRLKKTKN